LPAETNSTSVPDSGGVNDVITVKKGNRLANIPQHQLKLRLQYAVTPDWTVGSNVTAFSDRYMRGNENNSHVATPGYYDGNGKVAGYAIVNLDTRYNIGNGWSVFGKAINVFDTEYNNGGMMGETMFAANGTFDANGGPTGFLSPGAPRAGWLGVRYEFLAPKAQ
jgi:outer membrane receptor protein involved in Fe transport